MMNTENVVKVYSFECPEYGWTVTTNEQEAKQSDHTYTLATVDDLYEWYYVTGEVFKCKVLTAEGITVQWYEIFEGDEDLEEYDYGVPLEEGHCIAYKYYKKLMENK